MFSKSPASLPLELNIDKSYHFSIKGEPSIGKLELVRKPHHLDKYIAKYILVESFIGEYEKYLTPNEIDNNLTSWREGDKSVKKYYEDYFETELNDFVRGEVHYWVQAKIDGQLVGWATFQREKLDQKAVYINLLVVHPAHQKKGIGHQLVHALINLKEIPKLNTIHLLLRTKNKGGREFYSKLGFVSDPTYIRDDNFVKSDLLEALTWKKSFP